jgi:hypothetical protein
MKNAVLDNLSVPQPPYRMARFSAAPSARLATSENWDQDLEGAHRADQLQRLVEQEELPSPKKESDTSDQGRATNDKKESDTTDQERATNEGMPEKPSAETLERVGREADEAIERIRSFPPLETEQGRAEDEKNRNEKIAEIEGAALHILDVTKGLKKSSDSLEGLEPKRTKKEREEDARIAERMRPAVPPRTPAEKAAITRQHTAALKEDAARTLAKELEGGIEFEETATQRAGRLAQEALQRLNEFKNAKDRNASPEEIEFNSQRADIAQRRLEAAQRGEPIPDERVDMDRVKAAAKNTAETPLIKDEKQELVDLPLQPEAPTEIPPTPVREEEIVVEAEPVLGAVVEGKGKVVDYESSGKAIYEPIEKSQDATPEVVYIRPDTPEGKKLAETRAEAERITAKEKKTPAIQEKPIEREATEQEKLIAQLQERVAQLESVQRSESGPTKLPAEGAPKPGGAEEAIMREIGREVNKSSERPSWFEQQKLEREAFKSKLKAYWHSIWAKRCKDLLEKRNTQLKSWESAASTFKEKSYKHTALGILTHDPIVWALRKSTEKLSKRLESRENQLKRHIEERADLLNFAAAREDASRKVSESRAKAAENIAAKFDKEIDDCYEEHKKTTTEYAEDPEANSSALEKSQGIELKLRRLMTLRAQAMQRSMKEGKVAGDKQEHQNLLLSLVDLPVFPGLSGKMQRKEEVRKKPKASTVSKAV